MDLSSLLGSVINEDSLGGMSEAAGISTDEVKKVLSAALPSLLNGAVEQANNEETATGFAKALSFHSKDDTSDVRAFVKNADTADGEKIVHHLIGNDEATVNQISERAGVSSGNTMMILAMVAPLLLNILGKASNSQQSSNNNSSIGSIMNGLLGGGSSSSSGGLLGGLLGGGNSGGGLLGGLLGGGSNSNSGSDSLLGSILGGLFK